MYRRFSGSGGNKQDLTSLFRLIILFYSWNATHAVHTVHIPLRLEALVFLAPDRNQTNIQIQSAQRGDRV